MPATTFAQLTQNSSQLGLTLATAFPQVNGFAQNLDLLQIVSANGGAILLNVDSLGVVHNPAVAPTTAAGGVGQTRVGQFQSNLPVGSTTAQFFSSAFSNPSQQDILQVVNAGGNIHYFLNFQGVASGS